MEQADYEDTDGQHEILQLCELISISNAVRKLFFGRSLSLSLSILYVEVWRARKYPKKGEMD